MEQEMAPTLLEPLVMVVDAACVKLNPQLPMQNTAATRRCYPKAARRRIPHSGRLQ